MAELLTPAMRRAAEKFDRKADRMGDRWVAAVPDMKTRWPDGIQEFYGVRPGPHTTNLYNSGIAAVTATQFADRVRGKGAKMMEKARAGLML